MRYINADLIAYGLSPFEPEAAALEAAKLMAKNISTAVAVREDFAVETTLSGRSYIGLIKKWQDTGYQVALTFLQLPTAEHAIDRVKERVRQGGHSIPEDVIRRRFINGLKNFNDAYRPLVDAWYLYDAMQLPPTLMASGVKA